MIDTVKYHISFIISKIVSTGNETASYKKKLPRKSPSPCEFNYKKSQIVPIASNSKYVNTSNINTQ